MESAFNYKDMSDKDSPIKHVCLRKLLNKTSGLNNKLCRSKAAVVNQFWHLHLHMYFSFGIRDNQGRMTSKEAIFNSSLPDVNMVWSKKAEYCCIRHEEYCCIRHEIDTSLSGNIPVRYVISIFWSLSPKPHLFV